jgi:hypothetical protein
MAVVGYIWIAIEVLGLIDGLRHSGPEWQFADRNRAFWLLWMLALGPLFVLPYLLAVRPRFPNPASHAESNPFLKD